VLERLTSTLAQLGRFFTFSNHAGLFEKATSTHLRQDPVALDLFTEQAEGILKGLAIFDYDPCHAINPLSHASLSPAKLKNIINLTKGVVNPNFQGLMKFGRW
jgi:hypothetical protein